MEDKDKELEIVPGGQAEEDALTEGSVDTPDTPAEEKPVETGGTAAEDTEIQPLEETKHEEETESEPLTVMTPVHDESTKENGSLSNNGNGGSNKVWLFTSLALVVVLIIVLVKPPFATNKAEAVATVNGVEISKDQLYEELSSTTKQSALDQLIMEELVNQEAVKQSVEVTESDIDAEVADLEKSFGSKEALDSALVSSGMTMELLRENIQLKLLMTKLLEPQITVTDDEVKKTFEDYKSSFDTPEQVRASLIVVATEEEANDVIKQLKEGKDFAELAASVSLDEYTKANGGDTDFFARGEQEEAIEEAAFALAKDEVSEAVKTSGGYTVIKVTDRIEAHSATYEEEKDYIRKTLVSNQVSELSNSWIEGLRSNATITNIFTDSSADEASTEAAE
ncbi:hypothetical protein J41TS12_37390 [Paenibacillus antibioticophila]|uniref:peptidylprolyl isomerase n=1 Tax=Paenibacillus antibioticophila TaxID=1274374 RepID=A0A920CIM4_9BACL|nr:peptidyl-prolyl cis-trans isomerase [Paenibacillus antibioticophila]GIO38878.1 hypothetical protein J41TS12_37390 [Paenibacillus antibioticophila]